MVGVGRVAEDHVDELGLCEWSGCRTVVVGGRLCGWSMIRIVCMESGGVGEKSGREGEDS